MKSFAGKKGNWTVALLKQTSNTAKNMFKLPLSLRRGCKYSLLRDAILLRSGLVLQTHPSTLLTGSVNVLLVQLHHIYIMGVLRRDDDFITPA
jgi:hypothetical protein